MSHGEPIVVINDAATAINQLSRLGGTGTVKATPLTPAPEARTEAEQMPFNEAIKAIMDGKIVRRLAWPDAYQSRLPRR